jgi:mannosidase alpha-like ER degradation enhancer 1
MNTGNLVATHIDSLAAFWPGLQALAGDLRHAIGHHFLYFVLWRKYGGIPEKYDFTTNVATDPSYPLRPEFIESTYILYQATKNPFYLEVGASILRDLETYTRTKCGFASLKDLHTKLKEDRMESFFLSETMKYLYLLFDTESQWHSDDSNWVFNTGNISLVIY